MSKKQFRYRLSSAKERNAAAKQGGTYAPEIAEIMFLGHNIRKAIGALKPGESIQIRYRSFRDIITYEPRPVEPSDFSPSNVKITKRFLAIQKWRG